jgi:uncharacterized membrane protein
MITLFQKGDSMNGAHLHLLVNHVSLFCILIGVVALIFSMVRKSSDLRVLAVGLFVVAGIFGWIAMETGEQAEDILKAADSSVKIFIKPHEEAAEWAFRSCILIACLALATEWTARKKQKWFKPLQWILLVAAIHGSTVFATTAYLGGDIRHSEIRGVDKD